MNRNALRVMRRIAHDIADRRLGAGDRLGSEAELLDRYDVGRPVLREALLLLEHEGRIEVRRGPGGGAVVRDPGPDTVARGLAAWLSHRDATVRDLYAVREFIEARAAEWAAGRVDEHGAVRLRELLDREDGLAAAGDLTGYAAQALRFHAAVASISGNPVAEILVETLSGIIAANTGTPHYSATEADEERHAHRRIASAVIAGDAALASHRMLQHVRAAAALEEQLHRSERRVADPDADRPDAGRSGREAPEPPALSSAGAARR